MWLRALILEHFWLKLFSLFLATLVWLTVHASVNRETGARELEPKEATTNFFARPILIMTDSGAHAPVKVDPPTVDIAIRGGVVEVGRVDPRDVRAFVRIPERPDFDGTVPVHVQVPPDTVLVMVSPVAVRVRPVPQP